MADLIKKIKIKKQDGTFSDYIPIGADGGVYSNYKINIPSAADYQDYYVTIKAIGLTKIQLWGTEANQEIDIKCFESWTVN